MNTIGWATIHCSRTVALKFFVMYSTSLHMVNALISRVVFMCNSSAGFILLHIFAILIFWMIFSCFDDASQA